MITDWTSLRHLAVSHRLFARRARRSSPCEPPRACLLFSGGFHISALSRYPSACWTRDSVCGWIHPCTLRTADGTPCQWVPPQRNRLQPQYSFPGTALVGPFGQRLGYRAAGRSAAVTQCTARRHAMVRSATTNISCDGTLSIRTSLTPQHSQPCDSRAVNLRCTAQCGAARDVQCERDVRCGGSPHRCGATV